MEITKDIQRIQAEIEKLKAEYAADITASVEQNPDITVISKSPKCFTISSRDLSFDMCLSPTYYDFELQAKIIAVAIKQLPLERIPEYLKYVIDREYLPLGTKIKDGDNVLYSGNYNFRINPKVAERLKQIVVV